MFDDDLLDYPVNLPLGSGLRIELVDDADGALGSYDTEEGVIRIMKQPRAGQLIVLIHEALHALEVAAVNAGILKPKTIEDHHEFVAMASNGLATILAAAGLVPVTLTEMDELVDPRVSIDEDDLDNSQDCGGECHADCDPYPACEQDEKEL